MALHFQRLGARFRVAGELENQPGPQLAIVRYLPDHLYPEWVYNAADIDNSKLVWAREMDPASNRELLNYYQDRKAWLVEPDCFNPSASRSLPVAHNAGSDVRDCSIALAKSHAADTYPEDSPSGNGRHP